jgi:hypothetical protein
MAWLFTGAALSLSSALATRRQRQCFSGFQFSMNKQLLPCIAELYELLRSDGGYLFCGFASQDDEDAAHDLFEHETLITPAACTMLNGFETLHPLDKADP